MYLCICNFLFFHLAIQSCMCYRHVHFIMENATGMCISLWRGRIKNERLDCVVFNAAFHSFQVCSASRWGTDRRNFLVNLDSFGKWVLKLYIVFAYMLTSICSCRMQHCWKLRASDYSSGWQMPFYYGPEWDCLSASSQTWVMHGIRSYCIKMTSHHCSWNLEKQTSQWVF